jgi:mono/diheme cytochrome c family protein
MTFSREEIGGKFYTLISWLIRSTIPAFLLFVVACQPSASPKVPSDVTPETVNPFRDQSNGSDATGLLQEGERLFLRNCANCHGYTGQGDGPSRGSLVAPPANLTRDPISSFPDGQLFLAIRFGKRVNGKLTMPPVLKMSDEEIWKTVVYLRELSSRDH